MRDLHNNIACRRAISPVSVADNTAQVSQIIDRQGYGSLEFILALGSLADADATFAVTFEHGDDPALSDTAVPAATDFLGSLAQVAFQFDGDNTIEKIGYIGSKRYVRMTITPTSNASAALMAAIAVLGHTEVAPVVYPG